MPRGSSSRSIRRRPPREGPAWGSPSRGISSRRTGGCSTPTRGRAAAPGSRSHSPSRSDAMTILILDDEPVIRDVLKTVLEKAGFAAREAASAGEGIERLSREPIDLLLLDLML